MAVVRVEPRDSTLPPVEAASAAIAEAAVIPGVRALQVDFDATLSQRPFYRALLADLRRRVPQSTPLSMTALTSWCESDTWIAGLPVAEAVPCCSAWGRRASRAHFSAHRSAAPAPASPWMNLYASRRRPPRLYIFNPRPWTAATYRAALREVRHGTETLDCDTKSWPSPWNSPAAARFCLRPCSIGPAGRRRRRNSPTAISASCSRHMSVCIRLIAYRYLSWCRPE